MTLPGFYDLSGLEQIAVNLFYGWGYNFYRLENLLRADDQTIRARTGGLLGAARASIEAAEMDWRRSRLPPPSRERPRPDPAAVAGAQRLERLSRAIGGLEGQIRAQPVPENDRMTQWRRTEADTLGRLRSCDQRLAGQAEVLRAMLAGRDAEWILGNDAALDEGLRAIGETLADRARVLSL